VSTHYDEEAQVEELRRWWKENWLPLAGGLAVGLLAIFGWEAYTRHRDARAAEASQIFDDMKKAVAASKYDDAVAMADKLTKDFDSTPYAAAASLKMAQAAVDASKLDDADTRLQWVIAHGDDEGVKSLAKLRLARVLWQQGKTDEALKALDGIDAAYAPLVAELRGDIKLAQGDRAAAYAAYQDALAKETPESAAAKAGLQNKLDDLADVAPPATSVKS
jgi:predicted negative regulator of RcsB-dependent stress response